VLEFDLDLSSAPEPAPPPAPQPAPVPEQKPVASPAPVANMMTDLAFTPAAAHLDGPHAPEPEAAAAPAAMSAADAEHTMDFEFVLPAFGDGKPAQGNAPTAPASLLADMAVSPLAGISLDLDTGETSGAASSQRDQEMTTKLDLAVAYRDIGDMDGARELLDEVIRGGNADQVEKASNLRQALS